MTDIEIEGFATLIEGDSLDAIDAVGMVDHVITDPPYESHMHYSRGKITRIDGGQALVVNEELGFDSVERLRPVIAPKLVSAARGWALVFCTAEGVAPWRDALEAAEARYKRAMPYVKIDPTPQFNGQGPAHCLEMIVAAWCGMGYSRWNGGGKAGEFRGASKAPGRTGLHKTEKPLWLMRQLVALFTEPGDVILDPFMGVGTTGVAAIEAGRRFIGIETNPEFIEIANKRLRDVEAQPGLFEPRQRLRQTRLKLEKKDDNKEGEDGGEALV